MRHLGAARWVVVAEVALATYLIVLVLHYLWMSSAYATSELSTLIRLVALYGGLVLALPTILLMLLLLARRVAWAVAIVSALWMVANAILWLPVHPAVAAWAGAVAAAVLAALLSPGRATPGGA
jgi:hypothetical protein